MENKFDVIIAGAGPAGTATAIVLGKAGLSVALLDKATFPRDKTCGDALSVDVINQLKVLTPSVFDNFQDLSPKTSSYGVQIFAPDGRHVDIPFIYKKEKRCGYICTRWNFDNFLVQQLREFSSVKFYQNCEVTGIQKDQNKIQLNTTHGYFSAPIVVGADGAHSVIAKRLMNAKPDKEHSSAGLRVYYEGVTGFHQENFIELHFFEEVLPGYLWIFPLPDGKANVGIGMLSSTVSKKKINLKDSLNKLLTTHPKFSERFKNAKPLETIKGYGLPLGSKKRPLSGDRFLLTGDAASLIDPFSGEGIANAIRSGRIAANHILECFQKNDFTKSFNERYDKEIYNRLWKELKLSRTLQQLCKYPSLFNFVVKKANQSKQVHQLLIDSLAHIDKKKSLVHPAFYYRLLFGRNSQH
ncbi:geranylgeranyl reductase family protein [Chryseolinea sp. H1M3-3]|uniref:NAD(P)/FAD-dependent oxidoreductase n=1 Tax=Chryseolinea sp. H1M3-3 TaxID=3034144 RepID=UPI0023ED7372|nr:geranylgeranyl reductase family protein [Chryseolinea sp. H1M3-3]